MNSEDEIKLPTPLTPPGCDLRDFAFMPLDVARLRDSDMAAYESPEACWAAVLLWAAAWHQVPAASLPDDDRFLAKAAGYGRVVKEWENVRSGALHGWVKCADGRLYHPVVAEKALESWRAKLVHQWRKECDRIRKANKQRALDGVELLPLPPEPSVLSSGIPAEASGIPAEKQPEAKNTSNPSAGNPVENSLKGEGEGQGELTTSPKPPDGGLVRTERKAGAIALHTFLAGCEERGERPLRDYAPLWNYAKGAGLSQDFIALAWIEFRRRFLPGGTGEAKRYKDWRQAFRKYVEGNYLKLWAIGPDEQWFLTTQGKAAQKIYESKEAA